MNKSTLKFVIGYSFIIAAVFALLAELARYIAIRIGLGVLFSFYFFYSDFPLLRFFRISDSYFVGDEINILNYAISHFLTFLAWWLMLAITFQIYRLITKRA